MTRAHPNGLVDLDPLPDIPRETAEAGLAALTLALAQGPSLRDDPYALAKCANYDRLLFDKMPILCDGPNHLISLAPTRLETL